MWNSGIAPDGTRYLFPIAGISYLDCVKVGGMTLKEAARKLGVSEQLFRQKVKALGMEHWYVRQRATNPPTERMFSCDCCDKERPHKGNRKLTHEGFTYWICSFCQRKYRTPQMIERVNGNHRTVSPV